MMDAARCGNPADAEEAIQLGADLTASDDHGMTALHYAAARGSMGIVKLLIKFGAPLDAVDSTGMSPLHSAVIHDRTAVVSKLLAAACSVDLLDARGFTPLHHAASTGQLAMVRLLVEAGCASLQIKTRLQLTPLLCAIEKRRCNTIRYLADAQKPPFVLPAEPSDFHPSCPNPSSTLMRFLKTLPPRPSQSIQNDAEVRAALGPRTALNDSETAAVQAEVEKVKGERTISLVRREAEEEEEAGASRSDGEGEGAKKLEEVLTGITDQDAEAKRSTMWTGRRDAAKCVTGMVRRALVQREHGATVQREVKDKAQRRWAAAALGSALLRWRLCGAARTELAGRAAAKAHLALVLRARSERAGWRRGREGALLLVSCVQRRTAHARLHHLKYVQRAASAELLACACSRSVRERALLRTRALIPPARDVLAPAIWRALALAGWTAMKEGGGRLVSAVRRRSERAQWVADHARRGGARQELARVLLSSAAQRRMRRKRASVGVLWTVLDRARGLESVRGQHAAARQLQALMRGREARVGFWRRQGSEGMERCNLLERRKQAKLRQPSWKRDQFQRELEAEEEQAGAHGSENQSVGPSASQRRGSEHAGTTVLGEVEAVWWPCFAVDHLEDWSVAEDAEDAGLYDVGSEGGEGCEHVLALAFGASISLPRPLSARPRPAAPPAAGPAEQQPPRPGSASGRPGSSGGSAGGSWGGLESERPGTSAGNADIHLDRPPTGGSASRPPLPSPARPGTSAGRPGTSGGRPRTSGGRPETSGGRPGTSAGRPGTSGGRPGTASGRPMTSGGRHFCGEEGAEEVVGRWGAAYESISLVGDDDLAEKAVENLVAGEGRSISEGLKCWLALCIARRRLQGGMREGGKAGRAGAEKGLSRLREYAEQGGRERREREGGQEAQEREGKLTVRQRICCLLHVGYFCFHLGECAMALKAFTAARRLVLRREEREGAAAEERWACALSPLPTRHAAHAHSARNNADKDDADDDDEGERGVGVHVEVGLGLVGVVAQANLAACLLRLGAPGQAQQLAEGALRQLTQAAPLAAAHSPDHAASSRRRKREEEARVAAEAEHVEVVRRVMGLVQASRRASGQPGTPDVVLLAEAHKEARRLSLARARHPSAPPEASSKRAPQPAPEAWSTQPLGRLGCFAAGGLDLRGSLGGSRPSAPAALGSARTSSQQVAVQISALLDAEPPAGAAPSQSQSQNQSQSQSGSAGLSRGSSSSSSSSASGAATEEGGDGKARSERQRFGPNGATWRMTHGTRPLSASRQKTMGFDPDIGRHAPYLPASSSRTILGGRNGQPVN